MKALILAGGSGTRLWPVSRTHFPKQFLKIDGKESLLRKTLNRTLAALAPEDIYILTSDDYFHAVANECSEIPQKNILLEPARKNTAPALTLAMHYLQQQGVDGNEVLFVTPSDHLISPVDEFCVRLNEAHKRASRGEIVTFGIRPHRPETGYGYLEIKEGKVKRFVEKPSLEKAQEYLMEGNYFWNSGMFLFSINVMKTELQKYAPHYFALFNEEYETALEKFKTLTSQSIDYAVMEKSSSLSMVALDLTWSDVGAWENVYDVLEKDENKNVVQGEVLSLDTESSLLLAESRMVATIGISNLIVVETKDVVLVADKERGQEVKQLVEKLKEKNSALADTHMTCHRPWGSYTVLEEESRYKIKRIVVKPQEKLSLQLHYHRSEHWIVVTGTAKVTINDSESIVHEGMSIFVPKSAVHRVENPGKVNLEIIEVQVGEYLGEDDIVRLEDIYGRIKEQALFDILVKNASK